MRIIVCSDLHLDRYTAGLCRFDDVTRSARAVVALAKSERCDGFAFMGDLADPGPAAHRCSAFAIEVASDLASAGIWSRWLVGNHDVVEDGSGSSTLSPLAAAIKRIVWERPYAEHLGSGVVAVALPHPPRGYSYVPEEFVRSVEVGCKLGCRETKAEAPIEEVPRSMASREASEWVAPRVVLVFGHLTVPGIERGSEVLDMPRGREVRYPIEAIRERWGDRVVMLNGHYHRSCRRAQGPVIVPGSLERLTKSEVRNEPGCLILEV